MLKVLADLRADVEQVTATYRCAVEEEQARCPHLHVAQCPSHTEAGWRMPLPPRRICEDCGIEEEGWGSGYKTLHGGGEWSNAKPVPGRVVRDVTRNALYRMRP